MGCRMIVALFVGLGGLIALQGCGRLPAIVPVQGTVFLNGQPLSKASVTFVPPLENIGAESNSTAVTDENGRFTLTCAYNNQPGAFVGKHTVLIAEPPLPENLRNVRDTRTLEAYHAQLGNRPIPADYSSISKSPIKIEVKEGQTDYKIELTR